MSRVISPLHSSRAFGALGKSIIYQRWRGITYVRSYFVPTGDPSEAQSLLRDRFSYLVDKYHNNPITEQIRQCFRNYADINALNMLGYNKYLSHYMFALQTESANDLIFLSSLDLSIDESGGESPYDLIIEATAGLPAGDYNLSSYDADNIFRQSWTLTLSEIGNIDETIEDAITDEALALGYHHHFSLEYLDHPLWLFAGYQLPVIIPPV